MHSWLATCHTRGWKGTGHEALLRQGLKAFRGANVMGASIVEQCELYLEEQSGFAYRGCAFVYAKRVFREPATGRTTDLENVLRAIKVINLLIGVAPGFPSVRGSQVRGMGV